MFGARGTGKSFLIQKEQRGWPVFDLLDSDIFTALVRRPKLIGERIPKDASIVVIDEIQIFPELLNEVHRLISSRGLKFLLTGSSARKLRRKGTNLLAGRAWEARLFPLVFSEIQDFDLENHLTRGGLPSVYLSSHPFEELNSYVNLYLKEEINAEALSRHLSAFSRFLEIMAFQNSEELSFEGIASDVGISAGTVRNYIEVLQDTLIGFVLPAFKETKKRKPISRAKFYYFDVGVGNFLAKREAIKAGSEAFGKAFEHFIVLELRAYLHYRRLRHELCYWRSTSGFEVDLVVGKKLAIEIKSSDLVVERHLKGLDALKEEGLIERYFVVSRDENRRTVNGIEIVPWKTFLLDLWGDKIL